MTSIRARATARPIAIAFAVAVLTLTSVAQERDRAKIPDKYKWDLTDIYPTEAAWRAAKSKLQAEIPQLGQFKGKLSSSAAVLADALDRANALDKELSQLRSEQASALRIQPRDEKRLVRALEVAFVSGVPLTQHFADTRSPIADYDVTTLALRLPPEALADRVARRVERQFERGVVDEVRAVLANGVPRTAHPFSGLVYRQVIEMLDGVRDEAATRALIVQENRRYARRQLIWFRKEPNLLWLDGPGESADALRAALAIVEAPR